MGFKTKNRIDHFLTRVIKTEGCWLWTGCKQANGYGVYGFNYKTYRAHRVSYALFVGPIPKQSLILHSCDNRDCVNPSHLRVGTHKENSLDAINRNRQVRGSNHGMAKFTEEYVKYLRSKYDGKRGSIRRLAEQENINRETLWFIIRRKRWAHI